LRGHQALDVFDRLERVSSDAPWVDVARIAEADELEHVAERVDLFRFDPPTEIAEFTEFAWCATPDSGYRLNLADGEWIDLREDNLGRWCPAIANARDPALRLQQPTTEIERAISAIDALVRKHRPNCVPFLTVDAAWRKERPTEKQLDLLRRR